MLPGIAADIDRDFESADFAGDAIEDTDVERDGAGRQIDVLVEAIGLGFELVELFGREGEIDGLGEMGDEFAVDVVGGDVELEGAVEMAVGLLEEGDLSGWEAEVDFVRDGRVGFDLGGFLGLDGGGCRGGPDADLEE